MKLINKFINILIITIILLVFICNSYNIIDNNKKYNSKIINKSDDYYNNNIYKNNLDSDSIYKSNTYLSKKNNFNPQSNKKIDHQNNIFPRIINKYLYNRKNEKFELYTLSYYDDKGKLLKKILCQENIFYTYHYNAKNQLDYRGAKEA
ncbi:MAG: hypothetical protein Q8895_02340 [Pigeon pea little leaf phytoplasma]|nr:hypothetical protein [Pigeon pea little leaf phytoplasma]